MLSILRALKRKGVLAINKRNADYTLKFNPRSLYPLVDDKSLTKQLAQDNGIAVPDLYGLITVEHQVRDLPTILGSHTEFVVKPAHGSGGEGILVIHGRLTDKYRLSNGQMITHDELCHHIYALLSGLYSLGGQPDTAVIEYRVEFDPLFERISYQGVPDIRIIVFLGIPVMAMVRLPTRMSQGKANLHQGAIGVGIDIATGETLSAVWKNDIISEHPDTGYPVTGLRIPNWEGLLALSAKCSEMTGLGYQGVDIALDKHKGPLMLEINARPGLNIQIGNNCGLLPRLDLVEKHHLSLKDVAERVSFARQHFRAALC